MNYFLIEDNRQITTQKHNLLTRTSRLVLFLVLLTFSLIEINAQENSFRINPDVTLGDTSQAHLLILLDYSKLVGNAEDIDGSELLFKLHGADEISRFSLTEVRYLGIYGEKERERESFSVAGPAFTDLSYLRTALPSEGKGRLRILNVLYGVAEFNLNEYIQLGAGLLLPVGPLLTQRARFSVGKYLHFGVANQLSIIVIDPFEGPFIVGDARAIVTYGTNERLLNFGYGRFYNTSAFTVDRTTTISLGGGGKIGRNWHAYGEMSIFRDDFGTTTVIPTFSASNGKSRHRWRFGIATVVVEDGFIIPLPFIGYDYHW